MLVLRHRDNNIHFEYAGISLRSRGEMKYEFRLTGLDSVWKTTSENFLDYPTLPSGDYKLELRAINKFGVKSNLLTIPFSVEKLLTEETWFRLLMLFALLIALSALILLILRRTKKKEQERNEIRNRIAELEQLALKSQMNPHFIFNCLNSIQQFVLDKDVEGSNRFITGFSRLIRQTLDISAKREITLGEEITYLSTYLELERVRFEGKFNYEVCTGDGINKNDYYIPPMMLQPFAENSIRHGIRYRKDNNGKIVVRFEKSEMELICTIQDNGIGRKEALRLKSIRPIEYQSKGMSLIASRIEYFNRDSGPPISLSVEDLYDEHQNSTGTRVVMRFPLQNSH
jgi:LytS/YehU family sensor histidine kinase